jgi:hypothetical protein
MLANPQFLIEFPRRIQLQICVLTLYIWAMDILFEKSPFCLSFHNLAELYWKVYRLLSNQHFISYSSARNTDNSLGYVM